MFAVKSLIQQQAFGFRWSLSTVPNPHPPLVQIIKPFLIIDDSLIRNFESETCATHCFLSPLVLHEKQQIPSHLDKLPQLKNIVIHAGAKDTRLSAV